MDWAISVLRWVPGSAPTRKPRTAAKRATINAPDIKIAVKIRLALILYPRVAHSRTRAGARASIAARDRLNTIEVTARKKQIRTKTRQARLSTRRRATSMVIAHRLINAPRALGLIRV